MMKFFSLISFLIWTYLGVLLLGYLSAGWLLAAFQVPWVIWLGTLGVSLHLVKVRTNALALASAWIVALVSIAAVLKAWTPLWDSHLPLEHAQSWALGLLLIWLWAHCLALLLAFAKKPVQKLGLRLTQTDRGLIILIWTAMGLGGLLCHHQLANHMGFIG
jgi:hypothetical protein